jgi:hypothetical protein
MSYSQTEESIISGLIKQLPDIPKTCIEVGAADGIWLSNTANLWKNLGWKAVLIEEGNSNFENLLKNTKGYSCMCYHKRIEPIGPDSIDDLVERGGYLFSGGDCSDIGVLSIHIDGNDYYIFEALKMKPAIVIVEFNATIPPKVDIIGPLNGKLGCSARALGRLAADKGYMVISISGSNIILRRFDGWGTGEFNLHDYNYSMVQALFKDHSLSYLVQDYEGNWAISGAPVYGFNATMRCLQGDQLWIPQK